MKEIVLKPIGYVRTKENEIPRQWTVSEVEGELVINPEYQEGLKDIKPGEEIVVIFYFHQAPAFTSKYLIQKPPHLNEEKGVFSTCSPIRPNPIGLSVLKVLEVKENVIKVKRLDMFNGTPILDLKPYVKE